MNLLSLVGLIVATFVVGMYVAVAVRNQKKPELGEGLKVFVGAVSVFGAIRLFGCALTGQFSRLASSNAGDTLWSLSSEDAVFVVIGAIALAWVSIQAVWEGFASVRARGTDMAVGNSGNLADQAHDSPPGG